MRKGTSIRDIKGFVERIKMRKVALPKIIYIFPVIAFLALLPYSGKCECAVAGAVCGESPTWNPCCEPDKYECTKVDDENFGTCEEKDVEAE
jgi:hypothetical protein